MILIGGSAPANAADGFLFVTFKGEQTPLTEQIYFALSKDGRNWTALNDGNPVLVSQLGEKGVRDPYLLRSHDGAKFYLIATDLSVALNRNWGRAVRAGSRSILVWESTDLVRWSAPRLASVAHEMSGCAWSPEAIYDPEKKAYLVYWSSTVSADRFAKHSVWATYTRDFVTFDYPFLFIEKSGNLTDPSVVGDGRAYYRFAKDQTTKTVLMETAPGLGGPWRDISNSSLNADTGHGGPICYPLATSADGSPSISALFLYHEKRGYQPFVTGNLSEGRFQPLEGVRFPFRFQQGSVLPLRAGEYDRLLSAYGR